MCSVTQSCLTLCHPSLPGSFVHVISQSRILEWAAISSPRELPKPAIKPVPLVSRALAGGFFTTRANRDHPVSLSYRKLHNLWEVSLMSYLPSWSHMGLLVIVANNLTFILSTDGHLLITLSVFQVTSYPEATVQNIHQSWNRTLGLVSKDSDCTEGKFQTWGSRALWNLPLVTKPVTIMLKQKKNKEICPHRQSSKKREQVKWRKTNVKPYQRKLYWNKWS